MIIGPGVPVTASAFPVGPENYVASFSAVNGANVVGSTAPATIATIDLGTRSKGERIRMACLGTFQTSLSSVPPAALRVRQSAGTAKVVHDLTWGAHDFSATKDPSNNNSYATEVWDAIVIQDGTLTLVYQIDNGNGENQTCLANTGVFSAVVYS